MTREELIEFYSTYHNLYKQKITSEIVSGATLAPEWCILETVPPPDEALLAAITGNSLVMSTAEMREKAVPLVFRVLAVGSDCKRVKAGDFCLTTFLAGDKASQEITLVREKDIYLVYGEGLRNSPQESAAIRARIASTPVPAPKMPIANINPTKFTRKP